MTTPLAFVAGLLALASGGRIVFGAARIMAGDAGDVGVVDMILGGFLVLVGALVVSGGACAIVMALRGEFR